MKIIRSNTINSNGTIYLPNAIRKALKLDNGGKLSLEVIDGALIIKPYFNIAGWAVEYLTSYDVNVSIFYKVGRDRLAGITTVILSNGKIGVAQCSPNDAFDDVVGEAIALARALGRDDEIPKEVFE